MTNSNETLPRSCAVCTNKFTLRPLKEMSERTCPFCGSVIWPATAAAAGPLCEIGGFEVVRPIDWKARAVVFEAKRDGKRFLITLLDSGDLQYLTAKHYRDQGLDVPYGMIENSRHPNFLEFHPVQWVGDVAIAAIEYIDGKTLLDWVKEVGPINVADAVSIVLACVRFVRHVDGIVCAREIKQQKIHVTQNGEIKITAFGRALMSPFEPSPDQLMQPELLSNPVHRSKQRGFGMGLYNAPEADRAAFRTDDNDEKRCLESVYCLGCLLFELITDQPTPKVLTGIDLIRKFEWVPVHKIQPAAPVELSPIINRMAAFDPSERYQDFESLIDDLEALNIDSPRVSFVNRTGPPVNEQAIQADRARRWVGRTDEYDFRKVRWGMTQDEVREAEPTRPTLVMPVSMMFNTSSHDLALLLIYRFAEDKGKVFCIGVSLQQDRTVHDGYLSRESDSDGTERRKLGYHSIEEELKQLRRDCTPEEVLKKQQELIEDMNLHQDQTQSISDLQSELDAGLYGGTLDKDAVNATYEKFKELIVADYGEPELIDGPLNEDPEYIQALADQSDPDNPDDIGDCKSTCWRTESTYIALSIRPEPFGDRAISASFVSMKHSRFIPGHPDYKRT